MIDQTLKPEDRVELPAALALRALSAQTVLHNGAHGLRHPLGVYNTSILAVANKFLQVLAALDTLTPLTATAVSKKGVTTEALTALDGLLDALMEHMDDVLSVLSCFFVDNKSRNQHGAVRTFQAQIRPYRDHIGKLVNHLKHKQGRLRVVVFDYGRDVLLGYYAEGMSAGAVGPMPTIHDGGDTAFSFNRDLRFHMANLFSVSSALATAIGAIAAPAALLPPPTDSKTDPLARTLVEISRLSASVFPDEVTKPWPRIALDAPRGRHQRRLIVEYPAKTERPRMRGNLKGRSAISEGDGVSRTFRVPYLANHWNAKLTGGKGTIT